MNPALKWKLIAGFVLVFVAGGVTGGFLGASTIRHYFLAGGHHGMAAQRMRQHLKAELNLTPEQMAKITPITDNTAAQLEEIRRDTGSRVRGVFASSHEQIAAVLTPEQRDKFEQLRHRHHRMMGRFHGRRGHMPPRVTGSPTASP
jgi:Spy/CpxP family protein refolding chaperone